MTKRKQHRDSGNDGSWFLEIVGALPPAPTPSETIAALETDNTLPEIAPTLAPGTENPPTVTLTPFDGSTGTSTSTYEPALHVHVEAQDDTGEMEIPAVPSVFGPFDDTQLSPVLDMTRRFRWSTVAFGVFVLAMVVLAVVWVPTTLNRDALGIRQAYAETALALRQYLPTSQSALDAITTRSSVPDELAATIPMISQLDRRSNDLELAALTALPRQLRFLTNDAADTLGPLQDTARIIAAQGSDVARQLANAYAYRTAVPALLASEDLPTAADAQTISALTVLLASSLVDDSSALTDLPDVDVFAVLNEAVRTAVERYAVWQDEYLTALSQEDETTATALLAEREDMRAALGKALDASLSALRIELDQQIVDLASDLDVFLAELTQI
ncbi:MAG: hypothetical protein QGD89_00990 [Actinomycetota bacterium]|nr:hypothetical protein [Actinomycetota bacterium]